MTRYIQRYQKSDRTKHWGVAILFVLAAALCLRNLLRSTPGRRPLLGILMYPHIHSGSCAADGAQSPSLATVPKTGHDLPEKIA